MHASGLLCDDAQADPAAQEVRAARSPDEATGLSPEKVALDDALPGGGQHPDLSPMDDRATALFHRHSDRTITRITTLTADLRRGPSPGALSRSLRFIHGSGGGHGAVRRETCLRASQRVAGSRSAERRATRVRHRQALGRSIEPRSYLASQPCSYRASQPTSFAATWPIPAPKQRLGRAESVTGSVRARRGISMTCR